MSDLKCPFCQQKLSWYDDGCGSFIFFCNNCDPELYGSQELWQELINERQHATDCQDLFIAAIAQKIDIETELEHTRKALDVAVDEITKIKVAAESVGIGFFMTAAIFALAKIKTALEQKE